MKEPLILLGAVSVILMLTSGALGYHTAYSISYGAFSIMAAGISGTFFWLWARRTTPLALGMAFGWAGAASVMGWWWIYSLAEQPDGMKDSPVLFFFLAIYFVGSILHFQVIGRSFGTGRNFVWLPVAVAIVASIFLHQVI